MAPLFDSVTLPGLFDKLLVVGLVYGCTLIFRKEAALRLSAVLTALFVAEFGSEKLGLHRNRLLFSSAAFFCSDYSGDHFPERYKTCPVFILETS